MKSFRDSLLRVQLHNQPCIKLSLGLTWTGSIFKSMGNYFLFGKTINRYKDRDYIKTRKDPGNKALERTTILKP
jgi:hypothetical protein